MQAKKKLHSNISLLITKRNNTKLCSPTPHHIKECHYVLTAVMKGGFLFVLTFLVVDEGVGGGVVGGDGGVGEEEDDDGTGGGGEVGR